MPDLLDGIPVTPQSASHLPDAPRSEEEATAIGPLSAHVAVLSMAKPVPKPDATTEIIIERVKP